MTFPEVLHKLVDKVGWFTEAERGEAHAAVEEQFPPAEGEPSVADKVPDDAASVPEDPDKPAPVPDVPSQETGGVTQAAASSDTPPEPAPDEAPEVEAEPEPVPAPAPAAPPQTVEELQAENARLRALAGIGEPAAGENAGVVDVPNPV